MSVATNLKKDDGSRAIGTILDPNGPALLRDLRGKLYRERLDAFHKLLLGIILHGRMARPWGTEQ